MRRAAALALALLLLAGCGAGSAPVPAETAEAYAFESFELAGFPAVSGGAVYDCAGGSGAEVWPEAGAPLDAPDIIGFGYNSPESMAANGWLLDMYTLMGDFPREDFQLGPFETDGALYAVSPEYHVYTLVGLEADFGSSYVHPISDFKDMGVHYYGDAFLTYSIPLWIQQNRQGADCDFTSPEFLELLEAARSMDKAESQSSKKLALSIISGTHDLIIKEKRENLELWPVGFPGGSYISPIAAMGIHAATPEPEAAWEFIRWCVAERGTSSELTLNIPAMEEMFYELLHPYEDLDPEKVIINEDGSWEYEGKHYDTLFSWEPSITERQADMMLGLVENLDTVIYCDAELVDLIREDAGAFLSGARSLKDTAALLGDRLGTYLAEKYG